MLYNTINHQSNKFSVLENVNFKFFFLISKIKYYKIKLGDLGVSKI